MCTQCFLYNSKQLLQFSRSGLIYSPLSPLFYLIQLQRSTFSNPNALLIIILPKYHKSKCPPESKFGKEQKIENLILTYFKIYYETTITNTYNTDIQIDKQINGKGENPEKDSHIYDQLRHDEATKQFQWKGMSFPQIVLGMIGSIYKDMDFDTYLALFSFLNLKAVHRLSIKSKLLEN